MTFKYLENRVIYLIRPGILSLYIALMVHNSKTQKVKLIL